MGEARHRGVKRHVVSEIPVILFRKKRLTVVFRITHGSLRQIVIAVKKHVMRADGREGCGRRSNEKKFQKAHDGLLVREKPGRLQCSQSPVQALQSP